MKHNQAPKHNKAPPSTLGSLDRILDANLDRAREGLRVLEDIARFALNDSRLSGRLKDMRHRLVLENGAVGLLGARDVEGDTGAFLNTEAEGRRAGLFSVLEANAKRTQESLRVLEEVGKLLPQEAPFKEMRFALYQVEREMASRLLRNEKAAAVRGLYVIIDGQALGGRTEVQVAQAAISGGASVIQFRDKVREKGQVLPTVMALRDLCKKAGVIYLINDHVDLALAVGADGVHVGQKDLPVPLARRLLPIDALVGCSTNNVEEALRAQEDGADYVAVGALFPTSSKSDIRPASLRVLEAVRQATTLPIVAIGGINRDNAAEAVAAGADAVAVIGAVSAAPDPEAAARDLCNSLERGRTMGGGPVET
ncbi:MAG TPA: thiamine phosphate synthase [Dehalococcoidia bacterium]|nr:thiamine phosphate synthase [Dehalococcoidia bacterium]